MGCQNARFGKARRVVLPDLHERGAAALALVLQLRVVLQQQVGHVRVPVLAGIRQRCVPRTYRTGVGIVGILQILNFRNQFETISGTVYWYQFSLQNHVCDVFRRFLGGACMKNCLYPGDN